nr:MAG TPA: hypothetical protein [Caudoviricetes sp.]
MRFAIPNIGLQSFPSNCTGAILVHIQYFIR